MLLNNKNLKTVKSKNTDSHNITIIFIPVFIKTFQLYFLQKNYSYTQSYLIITSQKDTIISFHKKF